MASSTPREWVTATEAVEIAGLSLRTITAYLTDEAKRTRHLPSAKRVHAPGGVWHWEIPIAEVEALRHTALSAPRKTLLARVEALEARVARLEAENAALRSSRRALLEEIAAPRQRAPRGARAVVAPSDHARQDEKTEPSESARSALQRQSPPKTATRTVPDAQDAPPGWVVEATFCRDEHGVPLWTVERYEQEGKLTITRRRRFRSRPRVFPTNWLTPEQQAEFHRAFRERIGEPCRVCGWSAARELVPTVKRTQNLAEFGSSDA